MSGVELNDVYLSALGSGQLVHDLDLKVADGEFLVLLGDQRGGRAVLGRYKVTPRY